MAKESIVPGLGKKQAAVLNNEEGRRLEHKRHLEELGFPKEVDPAFARHAPVSYDDENPTPSKIVNQAGQDLGDPNKDDSSHYKEYKYEPVRKELIDISSIVKEAVDEVFIQKDKPPLGFVDTNTKSSGLKKIFSKAGKLLPWVAPLLFNPVSIKALGITGAALVLPYAAWRGWNALENVFESDAERANTIETISKVPPTLRSNSQQGDLKEALDEIWAKKFGMGSTDGEYIDGTTKFADPADMGTYFEILYGGESNIPAVQIDQFLENYAAPDNVARRQELGIVGQAFDGITEFYTMQMGKLFGTADVGDSLTPAEFDKRIKEMSNSDMALQDTNSTVKNILSGAVDIDKLPSGSEIAGAVKDKIGTVTNALKENIPGLGLDIEIGSNLKTSDLVDQNVPVLNIPDNPGMAGTVRGTISADTGLDVPQQMAAAKTALEQPKKVRDIQSQIGSAMAGTGQTPTAKQEARTKFESPTLQIASKKRADAVSAEPTPPAPYSSIVPPAGTIVRRRNTQADLQSTSASKPPILKPTGSTVGSTSAGRSLTLDDGQIDGKQFGTISGQGTKDYRIEVNPKTYPKAKQGETIKLSKMDLYNSWIEKAEDEGAMAKVQLDRVSDLASMMHDILDEDDQLPGWIQNKISDSLHNLEASMSHIMYDEKQEQGLRKSVGVFDDFLAKAPPTRGLLLENEIFLQKFLGLGLLARLAPKVVSILTGGLLFSAAKKVPKKVGEEIVKKKGPNKTLLGLGTLSALGVAGTLNYQPPSKEKDEAMEEYNNLSETFKTKIDEEVKPRAKQVIDMLPDPIKEKGSNLFETVKTALPTPPTTGKALTAAQIADIGAGDRGADYSQSWKDVNPAIRSTAQDPSYKAASFTRPIYDTSPEYDRKVKREGAPEKIIGYETPEGVQMLNKPKLVQLAKANGLPAGVLSSSTYDPKTGKVNTTQSQTNVGGQSGDVTSYSFTDPSFKGPTTPTPPKDPFATQSAADKQTGILPTAQGMNVGAAGKGGEQAGGGGLARLFTNADEEDIENAIVKEAVSEFLSKAKKKDSRLKNAGVAGYNKPKRTPKHPKKSHVVVAKEGDKVKTIRFGEQGASTAGDRKKGESSKMRKKRKSFKARHAKNIKRGKMSAAYWADKVKW